MPFLTRTPARAHVLGLAAVLACVTTVRIHASSFDVVVYDATSGGVTASVLSAVYASCFPARKSSPCPHTAAGVGWWLLIALHGQLAVDGADVVPACSPLGC